nr:MAG TPA_asm: hypothetical protein [Caudoviricetes sp.]
MRSCFFLLLTTAPGTKRTFKSDFGNEFLLG